MQLPKALYELANKFPKDTPLYVVGGAVRNHILGYSADDFDIASALLPEEVKGLLVGTAFCVVAEYKRTGTLVIKLCDENCEDKENQTKSNKNFCKEAKNANATTCLNRVERTFEYTTFRQDSYPLNSGEHTPKECVFTSDILADAKRRDFTCNALYYDILSKEIIDLVGGIQDIKNKVLRTVREPEKTLSEDALRIMRLARFYVQLGFGVEDKTLKMAKQYAKGLANISKERISEELVAIFEGVFKYDSKNLGVKASDGIRLLQDIGALKYIIPELCDMVGMQQNTKYHIYDVFNHTLATMDNLPPRLMMAGLLHDVAKPIMQNKYGKMYAHEVEGENVARDIMTRLKFSNAQVEHTARLVKIHMFNVDNKTRDSKCRLFIAENFDYIDDFVLLRRADGLATNPANYDDASVQRILNLRQQMMNCGMPIKIADLAINGNDLKNLGYSGVEIGETLKAVLKETLQSGIVRTRDELLIKLKK